MNNIRPALEYNSRVTIVYLTFAVPGTLIGLAQWLVIRKKVPRMSPWWILTNIPGLYVGMMISYLGFFVGIMIFAYEKDLSNVKPFASGSVIGGVGGAVGGAMGGIITGIAQSLVLARKVLLTRFWIVWILTSIVAWVISWSIGWALAFVNSSRNASVGIDSEVVFWAIFGVISGFLNGAVTGKVLVWALRRSRMDGIAGTAHHI
ncbi:hypothetical protein [Scytonema hofmannii]|uniref:hypothetical protein n=1 Tax=Scytonema hofmannii TaxID=34078 RepID=UPI0011DFAEBD|nr:hypothetical protein [Scytonema hofmannii]